MFRKCVLLIIFVFLQGCQQTKENNIDISDDKLLDLLMSKNDSLYHVQKEKQSKRSVALDWFFGLYFSSPDSLFSLDDDLIVYGSNADYIFIRTKNKTENIIWSSRCGVYEKLGSEQVATIDSLDEQLRIELSKQKQKGEEYFELFSWRGKRDKGYKDSRFEFYTSVTPSYISGKLYSYFAKNIFVHGCKKKFLITTPNGV